MSGLGSLVPQRTNSFTPLQPGICVAKLTEFRGYPSTKGFGNIVINCSLYPDMNTEGRGTYASFAFLSIPDFTRYEEAAEFNTRCINEGIRWNQLESEDEKMLFSLYRDITNFTSVSRQFLEKWCGLTYDESIAWLNTHDINGDEVLSPEYWASAFNEVFLPHAEKAIGYTYTQVLSSGRISPYPFLTKVTRSAEGKEPSTYTTNNIFLFEGTPLEFVNETENLINNAPTGKKTVILETKRANGDIITYALCRVNA